MENSTGTGADLLVSSLKACGVEFVFLEEHPETEGIAQAVKKDVAMRLINPVSEMSCVPMADACARYTGKPVASITAGGGHCLNQVMGITTAWGDKSPVISIGVCKDNGISTSPVFDREKVNIEEVFAPISVYHAAINKLEEINDVINRAVRESLSAKGGPAHIKIPYSVLNTEQGTTPASQSTQSDPLFHAQINAPPMAEPETVLKAVDLLLGAKRPFIFVGGGVIKANAVELINTLAIKTGIPILSGMGAIDAIDPDNPMRVGPSSYLSGEAFHKAIKKADVVLAVGVCFSGLDGFGLPPLWSGKIKFIQINIDHQFIALNPGAEIPIVADAQQALKQMFDHIDTIPDFPDWSGWLNYLKRQNQAHENRLIKEARKHKNERGKIHPVSGLLAIKEHINKADFIAVVDGGNTPLWAGMTLSLKGPRREFYPTGMGTIGVGIPMALGIKAAAHDKPVVLLTGDGSLMYNIQELELIKKYNLPIIIIVNNDSAWNMIRSGEIMLNKPVSTELPAQDYTEVAKSFGMKVIRFESLDEMTPELVAELIDWGLTSNAPLLIDISTDKDVFPDSLVSFIRVEMMGVLMPQPMKKTRRMYQSHAKLFSRNTWNIIKYLFKTV